MTDERTPDVPEVLQTPIGNDDVVRDDLAGSGGVSAGDGGVPLPREDQPDENGEPGLDSDQAEGEAKAERAWLRSAEGLILAYWQFALGYPKFASFRRKPLFFKGRASKVFTTSWYFRGASAVVSRDAGAGSPDDRWGG